MSQKKEQSFYWKWLDCLTGPRTDRDCCPVANNSVLRLPGLLQMRQIYFWRMNQLAILIQKQVKQFFSHCRGSCMAQIPQLLIVTHNQKLAAKMDEILELENGRF